MCDVNLHGKTWARLHGQKTHYSHVGYGEESDRGRCSRHDTSARADPGELQLALLDSSQAILARPVLRCQEREHI
jgi:hypothetical protein